jgi:hypothetical protein
LPGYARIACRITKTGDSEVNSQPPTEGNGLEKRSTTDN